MTGADAITLARAAGVTLHGLAVLEAAMERPSPTPLGVWPAAEWRWPKAGEVVAPPTEATAPTPLYLENAGLVRAPGADDWKSYCRQTSGLTPAAVAKHFFADSLQTLIRQPEAGAFSEAEYIALYPKVKGLVGRGKFASGVEHYVRTGAAIGNNPNHLFRERYYLDRYADVREAVAAGHFVSGFHHFLSAGQREGRAYRPADNVQVAVDLTFFAGPDVNGPFFGYSLGILAAIIRLLRGVDFVLLLPEVAFDAFSPWDSANVKRLLVPSGIRRPARELLNLKPRTLVSFGRPSVFRGEERSRLTFLADPQAEARVGVRIESGVGSTRKSTLRFVQEITHLYLMQDGDGTKVPFAVQKAISDRDFPRLATALKDVLEHEHAFAPSQEIIGVDEHGTAGIRSYINVVAEPGARLAVVLHCPEDRARQELRIHVRDATATALEERKLTVHPGQYVWEEIPLPTGLVQVEFQALVPQKIFIDGRWRTFSSVRFVNARVRRESEVQLTRPGRDELSPLDVNRASLDAFDYLAGYKGGRHATDVAEALGQLAKAFPAYRAKLGRFRWDTGLLSRPRFLIVSQRTKAPTLRRSFGHRVECLEEWARKVGFEPVLRETDFAPGWVRTDRLGVRWRDIACCIVLATSTPDDLSLIREISEETILLAYWVDRSTDRSVERRGGLRRLFSRQPDDAEAAQFDYEFFDHLALLRGDPAVADAATSSQHFLPMHSRTAGTDRRPGTPKRCGLFLSSAAALEAQMKMQSWVEMLRALRAANDDWDFRIVCDDAPPRVQAIADPAAQALGMPVESLSEPTTEGEDLRCMIFSEQDPGQYLDVLIESVGRSIACLVDTQVRAQLTRPLYVHTNSVAMTGKALGSAKLDDLIFEFDGAQAAEELKQIFHRNLSNTLHRLTQERLPSLAPIIPRYWS